MTMADLNIINSDGEIGELLNIFAHGDEPGAEEERKKNLRLMKNRKKNSFIEKLYSKYNTRDAT